MGGGRGGVHMRLSKAQESPGLLVTWVEVDNLNQRLVSTLGKEHIVLSDTWFFV